MQEMRSELAGLAEVDVVGLPDETVRSELLAGLAALNQLGAYVARLADSFDVRDLAESDGFRTARGWLSGFGRLSPAGASAWLARGRLLRALPALAAAAGRGAVSAEHLAKVADLASRVGVDQLAPFDEILADLAAAANPAEVAKACERIAAHLDPDGPDPDPDGAFDRRELTLSRQGSLLYLRGRLDPEGAAALRTALEALMRPPADGDLRTAGQRRADALVDLARLPLATGQLPTVGGIRPSLGILITPSALIGHHHSGQTSADADAGADAAGAGGSHGHRPADHRAGAARRRTDRHPSGTWIRSARLGCRRCRNRRGWTGSARSRPPWRNESPATPTCGASCSTPPPDSPSTSAGPTGWCRTGSAEPCTPGTGVADGPAAKPRPTGATPTTTTNRGTSAAKPTSTN